MNAIPKFAHTIEHSVGNVVRIQWLEESGCFESDGDPNRWHHFRIIGVWAAARMLLLEGVDEGKAKFCGPPFWVPVERIYIMEIEDAGKGEPCN